MKDMDVDDDAFKGIEAIIHSMTPEERSQPSIIDASRKKRIGKGNGCFMQTCALHHSVTSVCEHTSWVGRPSKISWLLCAVLAEHLQPCAACQKALEPCTELFLISRPHAHLSCTIGVWLPMAGLMLAGLLW